MIEACEPFAEEYYGDLKSMRASIETRAAFENEPTDLYRVKLYKGFGKALAIYQATGHAELFREAIDQRVSAAVRQVDRLLAQGRRRRLPDGGYELEMRTMDGIHYSVRAWNDATQTRRLHLSLPVERDGKGYLTALPESTRLTSRQIQALRYRFSLDGWRNEAEVGARLEEDAQDGLIISFAEIPILPSVGRLEGEFSIGAGRHLCLKDGTSIFRGYTFAVPDKQELINLIKS